MSRPSRSTRAARPSRLRISLNTPTFPVVPVAPSSSHQVFGIPELRSMIVQHLDGPELRSLTRSCMNYYDWFNTHAWRELTGLGNLLAILDESLDVHATGPGRPRVEIPQVRKLEPARIARFLNRAGLVKRLKVNGSSKNWVRWDSLDRLPPLVTAINRQGVIFPGVTTCIIQAPPGGVQELKVAPLARLVANPRLRRFWVVPNSSATHPPSSVQDALNTLSILKAAQDNESQIDWLGIFPETVEHAPQLRKAFVEHLAPFAQQLTHCTLSAWALSVPALIALSFAPLVRLEVQGRFAADGEDLSLVQTLDLSEHSFSSLQSLIISNVPVQVACQMLAIPRVLLNIGSLRVEVSAVDDLSVDEDEMYAGILTRAIEQTPCLHTLCLISSRKENQPGYPIPAEVIGPLFTKHLDALRLYRFSLEGVGLSRLLPGIVGEGWRNLRSLVVMHQNLTPEDLRSLSALPYLEDLAGNVSWPLGARREVAPTQGFYQWLNLTSQFRFGTCF
ncbi:hypothetical protein FRC11_008720 [Ceratobasidium sp. 423]|nr:hypothetical protein FRC11_008720 [Ceratobasidium sp. 423]